MTDLYGETHQIQILGGLSMIFYSMKKYVANCYSKTFEENH